MIYCLIKIHKSFVACNYVQNNFDLESFDNKDLAIQRLNELNAIELSKLENHEILVDIRGFVTNERGILYGYVDSNNSPKYISLVEMENNDRNKFINQ